jgi:hypothetical protein
MGQEKRLAPSREHIAARAYELYLERGGGDGGEIEDWLLAEEELSQGPINSGTAPEERTERKPPNSSNKETRGKDLRLQPR